MSIPPSSPSSSKNSHNSLYLILDAPKEKKKNTFSGVQAYVQVALLTVLEPVNIAFPVLKTFINPALIASMARVIVPVFAAISVLSCVVDAIALIHAHRNPERSTPQERHTKMRELLKNTAITAALTVIVFVFAPIIPYLMCAILLFQTATAFHGAYTTHQAMKKVSKEEKKASAKELEIERKKQIIQAVGFVCVLASIAVASFATFGIGMAVAIGVLAVASVCFNGAAYKNTVQKLLKNEKTEPNAFVRNGFFFRSSVFNSSIDPYYATLNPITGSS